MSQENVDALRRGYEAFARRDWSLLSEFVDPDVVMDLSRNVFNPDVYRGFDGFRRVVEGAEETWDDFEMTPEEFIDGGDQVVVALKVSGRGKGSGVQTEMHIYNVWTLRDGRALRIVGGFRDRAEALEAAGLRE